MLGHLLLAFGKTPKDMKSSWSNYKMKSAGDNPHPLKVSLRVASFLNTKRQHKWTETWENLQYETKTQNNNDKKSSSQGDDNIGFWRET